MNRRCGFGWNELPRGSVQCPPLEPTSFTSIHNFITLLHKFMVASSDRMVCCRMLVYHEDSMARKEPWPKQLAFQFNQTRNCARNQRNPAESEIPNPGVTWNSKTKFKRCVWRKDCKAHRTAMTYVDAKANLNLNSHAMNRILGCKAENSETGPADTCDLKFSKSWSED